MFINLTVDKPDVLSNSPSTELIGNIFSNQESIIWLVLHLVS